MSQNIRALSPLTAALEREDLERGRVGHGDHVGLVDPGEALDRRAVEADALLEGGLQLGRRHRDALERAEHVGEPQPDETDVALLERAKHELLLSVHVHPSYCALASQCSPSRYAEITLTTRARARVTSS